MPVNISTPELAGLNSNVYPNPFTDNCRIIIDGQNEKLHFELFDLLGNKVIDNMSINGSEFTFNRGNLSIGMYQYRILSSKSIVSTGKLIIN